MSETRVDRVTELIEQGIELLQLLLREREQSAGSFLEADSEAVESATSKEIELANKLANWRASLAAESSDTTLMQSLGPVEASSRLRLEALLRRLQQLIMELKGVNRNHYRHVQSSLSFTQNLLQNIFADSTSYDTSGSLRAVPKCDLRKAMGQL